MYAPETYNAWTQAFSPGSTFEGTWKQGSRMKFIDPCKGGTVVVFEEFNEDRCVMKHVAVLDKDHNEVTGDDAAQKWIGSLETYTFTEENGVTTLTIEIETHEDFTQMFEDMWPSALKTLKELCERGTQA